MTDEKKNPIPYKVRDKITGDVAYAWGNNRNQARNRVARDRFEVTVLSVREALGLKAEDLLDATRDTEEEQAELPIAAPAGGIVTIECLNYENLHALEVEAARIMQLS